MWIIATDEIFDVWIIVATDDICGVHYCYWWNLFGTSKVLSIVFVGCFRAGESAMLFCIQSINSYHQTSVSSDCRLKARYSRHHSLVRRFLLNVHVYADVRLIWNGYVLLLEHSFSLDLVYSTFGVGKMWSWVGRDGDCGVDLTQTGGRHNRGGVVWG